MIPFIGCFDRLIDKLGTLLLDFFFGPEEPFEYEPKTWSKDETDA